MKNILITWWAWYIGSHCVVELEKQGYNTIIIDNLSNSTFENISKIEKILDKKIIFHKWDILDEDFLSEIFSKNNIDAVIHFAWLKAVWESCENVWLYQENNIVWSIKLFKIMNKFGVKNIIFSSSATVYKEQKNKKWYSENDETWNTTNPYWTSKYIIEILLRDYVLHQNWKAINLRYFNPIWAHESWLLWETPNGIPNNLLPYIMKVANWELSKLRVFGNDYDTVDWTWVRDYIDVVDLSIGHIKALEYLAKQTNPVLETFNLWVWKWVSVLEMHKICKEITQKDIAYEILARRSWDIAEVYCNPEKAFSELNWKTKTSLEDSIKNMWKFYNRPLA